MLPNPQMVQYRDATSGQCPLNPLWWVAVQIQIHYKYSTKLLSGYTYKVHMQRKWNLCLHCIPLPRYLISYVWIFQNLGKINICGLPSILNEECFTYTCNFLLRILATRLLYRYLIALYWASIQIGTDQTLLMEETELERAIGDWKKHDSRELL